MATKKQQEYDSLRSTQLRRHATERAALAARHKTESVELMNTHRAERDRLEQLLTQPQPDPIAAGDWPTNA